MSSTMLYRWSGIVLLIGGLVGVLGTSVDTVLFPGHDLTAQQGAGTAFLIDALIFLAWSLLLTLGLPGFYLRQARRAGKLGFAGFVLLSLGLLLGGVAFGDVQVVVYPYLAQQAPKLFPSGGNGPDAGFLLWILLPVLLLAVGAVLLGIATRRARTFPQWTGTLLIITGVLFLLSVPLIPIPSPFSTIIDTASNIALFIVFAWCGYLLTKQEQEAPEAVTSPAAQMGAIQ